MGYRPEGFEMLHVNDQVLTLLPELAWWGAKGAFRRQKIRHIDSYKLNFISNFNISGRTVQAWKELFPHTHETPRYLYHWPQWIRFYLRFSEFFGLRLSEVRLIGQDLEYFDPFQFRPGKYQMESNIAGVYIKKSGQIIAITESRISDLDQNLLCKTREFGLAFYSKDKSSSFDTVHLPPLEEKYRDRFEDLSLKTSKLRKSEIEGSLEFSAQSYDGIQYSALTGDPTFVHTHPALCPLFGFDKAFMQGSWITNYVLGALDRIAPQGLSIALCKPLVIELPHMIQWSREEFEVITRDEGHLVAFGQLNRKALKE
jgi:hypothetical protein